MLAQRLVTSQAMLIRKATTKRAQYARYALVLALHKVELGKIIARRRKDVGLTQAALARLVPVETAQTVSRWERGLNEPTNLPALAEALQTTPEAMIAELSRVAKITQRDRRQLGMTESQMDRIEHKLDQLLAIRQLAGAAPQGKRDRPAKPLVTAAKRAANRQKAPTRKAADAGADRSK